MLNIDFVQSHQQQIILNGIVPNISTNPDYSALQLALSVFQKAPSQRCFMKIQWSFRQILPNAVDICVNFEVAKIATNLYSFS